MIQLILQTAVRKGIGEDLHIQDRSIIRAVKFSCSRSLASAGAGPHRKTTKFHYTFSLQAEATQCTPSKYTL